VCVCLCAFIHTHTYTPKEGTWYQYMHIYRALGICGDADAFAREHKNDTVIVVCGDPVAYPGNEARLGMMTVLNPKPKP